MELKGKKVNFLGDSITAGVGASSAETRFVDLFGAKTGAIVRNYGISGTRIARKRQSSDCSAFDECYLDRVDKMDPDADIIVVFGGTNDFGHGDAPLGDPADGGEYTFYGAMKSLITRIVNRYPNAEIVIMTPLHRCSELVTTNEIGLPCAPLREFVNAEKVVAAQYSVPVLDLWSVSGIQPSIEISKQTYMPDGLHPCDKGCERIVSRLIGFLSAL